MHDGDDDGVDRLDARDAATGRRGRGARRVGTRGDVMTSRTTTRARTRLRRRARANARRDDSSAASASASAASVGENRSFDAAIESTAARGLEEAPRTVTRDRDASAVKRVDVGRDDDVNDALTRRRLAE